jgi:hypothetical protein
LSSWGSLIDEAHSLQQILENLTNSTPSIFNSLHLITILDNFSNFALPASAFYRSLIGRFHQIAFVPLEALFMFAIVGPIPRHFNLLTHRLRARNTLFCLLRLVLLEVPFPPKVFLGPVNGASMSITIRGCALD